MKLKILTVLTVLLFPMLLPAMPLHPDIAGTIEEDQVLWPEDLNTVQRPVRDPGMQNYLNSVNSTEIPLISGNRNAIVVNIEYPDYSHQYSVSDFQNMLFGTWSSGSAKDYYHEVSYDQFTLNGQVAGWYTADNNRAYYGYSSGFQRAAMLAKEAAQKADPDVDYSQYDDDGDGWVDMYTVIHSGFGREETGSGQDIHSHAWSFSSAGIGVYTTNDPWPDHPGQYIRIDDYTIDPERSNVSNNGSMICIGVFCHEWGHAIGLPDLYDTDYSGSGTGYFGLMSAGSWGGNGSSSWAPAHMTSWSKMDLGWITPVVIDTNATQTVDQVEDTSLAYQLWTDGNPGSEYFLIENRQNVGFDETLIGTGLLIYHIDENVINANRSSNKVNSGSTYGVAIEQADGLDELMSGSDRGDGGDPFPGTTNNTAFDSTGTDPDSRSNAGANTHVGVNEISSSSASMTAFFYINGDQAPEPPTVEFSAEPTSGNAPLEVTFTDESTGSPDSWEWDFGDGGTSTEQNPVYTYDSTGSYSVTLIASNANGSDTLTKTDYITVSEPSVLDAEFSATPTSGIAPLTVSFTDETAGTIESWNWDFGDSFTSTDQNPVHTYDAAGTYTVSLTVTDASGSDTETKVDYITVTSSAVPPTAEFSGNPTSGVAPLNVTFTDQSTGAPTSWSWDFGDGTTSTNQNPTHTFSSAGTYTVALTATNAEGSDTETKNSYITVTDAPQPPSAAFTADNTSGPAPHTVNFTDQSTGAPTSWSWDFGDGATSTRQNPSHTYNNSGTYAVSLTVSNAQGSDTHTESNYISVAAAALPEAAFSASPYMAYVPFSNQVTVDFTDESTGDPTSWSWDFGDGSSSTNQNPTHTYHGIGSYTVTLTITNADGSDDTTDTIQLVSKPSDFIVSASLNSAYQVEINYAMPVSTNVQLKVYNVNGQLVRVLDEGQVQVGEHTTIWDITDDAGRSVTPGVYYLQLRAEDASAVTRIIVTR